MDTRNRGVGVEILDHDHKDSVCGSRGTLLNILTENSFGRKREIREPFPKDKINANNKSRSQKKK